MITENEVKLLRDTIKKQSGVEVPFEAARTALYAVAHYNYNLIPHKSDPPGQNSPTSRSHSGSLRQVQLMVRTNARSSASRTTSIEKRSI
jgi:hypothetical protein